MKADKSSSLEDFEDFFENSLCGYVTADEQGKILRANTRLAEWLGCNPDQLLGQNFSDLLTIGGKIYFETHLRPLLKLQGFFDEVALELNCAGKQKLEVLVNALQRKDQDISFIRFSVFKATDRRLYEENLKLAKTEAEDKLSNALQLSLLREQFIAVLGHDLRNPLGSIIASASFLSRSSLSEVDSKVVRVLQRSANRMEELIQNVMDFTRTRLGEDIILNRQSADIVPVLLQVVEELQQQWPDRVIKTEFNIQEQVNCDPSRIAQLFSNLLANAITHGSPDTPVLVRAFYKEENFELAVCNSGIPISPDQIEKIFEPFTRESSRSSQQGLGLGLYIASQIARAHKGRLTVTSTEEETCFTFYMNTAML